MALSNLNKKMYKQKNEYCTGVKVLVSEVHLVLRVFPKVTGKIIRVFMGDYSVHGAEVRLHSSRSQRQSIDSKGKGFSIR